MKTNKHLYIATAMSGLLALAGCVNDLEVQPLDQTVTTAKRAYADVDNYERGLKKIYSVWALSGQDGAGSSDISGMDAGNTALLRSWWMLQEATTDEAKVAWPDVWCPEINGMTWGTNLVEPIEAVYQRTMNIVALSNEYLKNVADAPAEVDKSRFSAEARFCRALAYYVLLDQFATPPFITEGNYSLTPSQLSRQDLFNWIESELKAILPNLPAAGTEYGRADQGAVNALLARMYLNAEVYTGTERYTDCVEACKAVIAGGYALAPVYADLFKADNGENAATKKEIIFPILFDGNTTQSYGIAALILGARGGDEVSVATDGVKSGWNGSRSTSRLPLLFDYADASKPTAATILDKRGIFYDKGRSLQITTAVNGTFTTEGWAVHKYTNLRSDGTPGSNSEFPDTDFPFFRLGDVYLMYAEAVARGGQGGDMNTAVGYVNALRKRGYGDSSHDVNAAWLTANNYRNLLNERGRELYWEGTRRTDLIRFGLYTSAAYLWEGKGGIIGGVGVDARYNLFPIPATDLSVNGKLKQHDTYK